MKERFKNLHLNRVDYAAIASPLIGNLFDSVSTIRGFQNGVHEVCTFQQHLTTGGNLLPFMAFKLLYVGTLEGVYILSKTKANNTFMKAFTKTVMFGTGGAFMAASIIDTLGGLPSDIASKLPC